MKTSAAQRVAAAAGALLLAALAPAPLQDILSAERSRSLDDLPARLAAASPLGARSALAIGRTKDRAGVAPLRERLHAEDATMRAMAAYALGLLVDAASLSDLRQLAKTDNASAVRYAAVDAIGRIGTADSRGALGAENDLLHVTEHDGDAIVRGHAAANLDVFRTQPVAQRVASALQRAFGSERDDAVRWHIMWTLARAYPTLTARSFFAAGLHDGNDIVRLEAVRGLGRRKDRSTVSLVRPLLRDRSWRVQEEASEALRRLGGKAPTQHLAALQNGLHLPAIVPAPSDSSLALPRPSAASKPKAPTVEDVLENPPLAPTSAALMNGPMPGPHPRVRLTTSKGTVVVRLYPEWAPFTVASFLALTDNGFFDGIRWFRIVPDFVVQTGDRTNTGNGDAGYTIGAEENPIEQRTGVISMGLDYDEKTNTPKRDSAGSQFYITLSPQLHLDRDFTVFGEVESGFSVLAHLVESDTIVRAERISDD
ncbi:MAG: peptidylprolyl isomerase [Candidatus Eremiobacteraeota bacterium]|nr:peptidylprolyl isomerase [Candidatus Eremiobacteraeota bacterium]